jgi:ligand-binding sensor domain-containing protein/class 3 adenylate cyclase/predicted metal-dependent HD superfamily phosphohydrolase
MKLFLSGFLSLFVLTLFSQTAYRFRNYSINDGLSQSSVTSIIQDDNHSLWIGTQDGLNRFDGKNFEIFTSDDTKGLESQYIKCSVKTADGKLWFGTTNGLTVYDPDFEKFQTFSISESTALQIESIALDPSDNLWVGTSGNGVLYFNKTTHKFTVFDKLVPTKKIQAVFCSRKGELFVNTEDKGLFKANASNTAAQSIIFQSKNENPVIIQRIVQWKNDYLLFGTNQGIFEYSINENKSYPKLPQLEKEYGYMGISDIYLSKNNTWFIGTTNKGLFTVTKEGTVFNSTQDIFQKNALLFNDINMLFVDDFGTFWVGTDRGLASFDPNNQGFLGVGPSGNLEKGIPSSNVWSFAEDVKSNYVYVGTDIGISRFNRKTGKFEQFYRDNSQSITGESAETAVLSMISIAENRMLVGCVDGLFELTIISKNNYTYKRINFLNEEDAVKHVRIYSLVHWKEDKYIMGTKAGAVLVDLKNKKATAFEHSFKNPKTTITAGICRYVTKDKYNRIWFATSSGELSQLVEKKGTVSIVPYKYNSILLKNSKDYISAFCQTSKYEYWFGTFGSGLMYWNEQTKTVKVYTKKDGLPNNVVYSVLQDQSKNLWMSTNKGICCFNPSTKVVTNYTEIDGLMSNEFNLGAYMFSQTGELFFGGIYGYNYFNPRKMGLNKANVNVKITKFKLDKGWLKPNEDGSPLIDPISQTRKISLSYRQRSFTLHFQPSDLSNPELLNYKYILEGSDEGEIMIGNSNELHFNALSPGHYTLKIYARVGEGPWGKSPAILEIHIQSPFWATWWFWVIVIIFLAIAVRVFIRSKIESGRREQVRLEMKITERTREIRAQNVKIENQRKLLEEEKNKVVEQQRLLQIEKDKTEKLLRNVMPESTAEELKKTGTASARAYKTVSVLFTDFVGFTKIAEHMNPTELVGKLDVYFRKFDEIIVNNNLEKIKTIGDAYMCAGGVPVRNNTNPIDTCLAALQIQDYMRKHKNDAIINNTDFWELRLGINTGEVTAGVIGSERLAFDVWGATVNHAQRMEMLGEPGKVTITGNTFKLIEPYFECVFRGKAQTKSRGLLDMYTVERIKPELSINGEGVFPNDRFHQIVNLHHYSSINYYKAERHIIKVLEKGLSDKLHYHSIEHTKDVVKAVERLALMEGVTDEGLFLLKSAATYHDAGFVEQYDKNEPVGARLAEEILPKYGYTEQHIEKIKELIYVTQIPHKPQNNLEEIICDADLDYLGREDFHEIADRLRRELREHGKIDSDRKWDELQVSFLTAHRYFTETAIRTRKEKKLKNLEEIKARLERDEYLD